MQIILYNIGILYGIQPENVVRLYGKEMSKVHHLDNAWIYIKDGVILDFGTDSIPYNDANIHLINAEGQTVLPGLIDSHTHLIYAKPRAEEFEQKIQGKSYEEIAAAGGGILNSAKHMEDISEDELFESAKNRILECMRLGTVAFEIKSGYGLNTRLELKMLKVAAKLKEKLSVPIKRTFLGAHAIPLAYKDNRDEYIQMIIEEMLPQISENSLADYIDVFCEKGFFTHEETEKILKAGLQLGLKAKIHVNQLSNSGGVQLGIRNKALSVDHLEEIGDSEIFALSQSSTIPVALPGCSFFLNIPYAPSRKMIDAGLSLALASDFNPGSSPSGNLLFIWSLACIQMKLTPEEGFNALTLNAASALELSSSLGSITLGKQASLLFFKSGTTLNMIPYHFAMLQPQKIMIKGQFL